jgi:hypothetical protein
MFHIPAASSLPLHAPEAGTVSENVTLLWLGAIKRAYGL